MHHGTNNMAKEKKLLKEINASQKKGDHCDDSCPSVVQEISNRIRNLMWDLQRVNYYFSNKAPIRFAPIKFDEKQVLKEITELKCNAPVKGKTWNSLPSKSAIKQQIKLMEQDSCDEDRIRKEHMQLRSNIQRVKEERNAAIKDIGSLERQMIDVRRRKGEANKVILKLIKIQNQEIS